jgi:pimeloyl-ACP methyl ester carboxylesterase
MSKSEVESVKLNGVKFYYSINDCRLDKPIILYLHGGPGDACIPLTKKYNSKLEEDFIFVNWDQRGSGLSYYPFSQSEKLNLATILDDTYQFVQYLLEKCNQKKLIIMGHSWGTVIGISFIQKYPELVSHYIGIGQVVNMKENIDLQKKFLRTKMKNSDQLDKLDFVEDPIKSSLVLTKKIVSYDGSLYGSKNYLKLIVPFIFSKDYSIRKLINRLKGSNQSIEYFWKELLEINFENYVDFKMPILFCEGRYDAHVSSKLVDNYAKRINSPVEIIWFESSGHFPQWEESAKFNDEIQSWVE